MRTALLTVVVGSLASCAPTLGLEARYGAVNVDGHVGLSAGSVSATNSADSMGIEDDDSVPSVRADLKWGTPHLSVTLQDTTHDGDGTLEADITEGGVTIPAGTTVNTDMDLGLHTVYLTFDLFPGDWELGLGLGVVVMELDLEIVDGLGNSLSTDEMLPIPVLAARAGGSLGPVDVEALAGGMVYEEGGDEVSFLDFDVNGSLRVLGDGDHTTGWLTLGLRYTDFDAEYSDDSDEVAADLRFSGPYFGLRVVF